jgi:hypothetical protein
MHFSGDNKDKAAPSLKDKGREYFDMLIERGFSFANVNRGIQPWPADMPNIQPNPQHWI